MRISCDSCRREFTLSEERLPDASRFRIKCPSCGNRIAVERPASQAGGDEASREAPQEAEEPVSTGMESTEFLGLTPEKENNGLLLVSDDDLLEALRPPLEEQGYHLVATPSATEAIQIFYSNPLSLFVVEDLEDNVPFLRELHSQPGYTRREMNCLLVGDRALSLDKQQAFLQGVNTYLSRADRGRYEELLPRAVGKFKQFLHPWLVARGEV
jgi:predicted Zn finger-like uncharacterized protein